MRIVLDLHRTSKGYEAAFELHQRVGPPTRFRRRADRGGRARELVKAELDELVDRWALKRGAKPAARG